MKKVTVKTDLIKKALPKLGAAISAKPSSPALENILCNVEGGTIKLTTTDLEMMVRYNLLCSSDEPVEFLLPYHLFSSIVKLCKSEDIVFEVLKTTVKVVSGTDLYTIKFNSKIELFPKLSDIPAAFSLVFHDEKLPMISAAAESVGKLVEGRPQLNRVCIKIKRQGIDIVGTDAFILYKYHIPGQIESETELLLSPRMVKALEGMSQITIKWDDKKFCFESPEVLVVINRPEFKYPDYNLIIPNAASNTKVNSPYLLEAFQKLNLSSFKDATLWLTKETLKVSVEDATTGLRINSEAPCEYTGDVEEILLDTTNVLRLLHQTNCEMLEMAVQSPTKAVVFRGEDPNYLALIVPSKKL